MNKLHSSCTKKKNWHKTVLEVVSLTEINIFTLIHLMLFIIESTAGSENEAGRWRKIVSNVGLIKPLAIKTNLIKNAFGISIHRD